jgi:transposase
MAASARDRLDAGLRLIDAITVERTSDTHTRRGHITKQGSRWLRWMLVEAATTAVRDPQLGRFAGQIAQRRGPKIARVALARRLLTLC